MGAGASQDPVVRADTQARVTKATDKGSNSTLNKSKAEQSNNDSKTSSSVASKGNNSELKTETKAETSEKIDSTKQNDEEKTNAEIKPDIPESKGDNMSESGDTLSETEKDIPLTMDKYKEREEAALKEAKETCMELELYLLKGDMDKVHGAVYKIQELYYGTDGSPPDFIAEYHKKLAKLVTAHEKFVPIVCESLVKLIKENNFHGNKENLTAKYNYNLIYMCCGSFQNFTDCSNLFREQFGKHEEVIKFMAEKMLEWAPVHMNKTLPKEEEKIVPTFLGIAHNLAMLPENVNTLRKYDYVKAVAPYLESHDEDNSLTALATLADILNEEECHLLQTSEHSIKFLLSILCKASKSSDRRYMKSWSAAELGRTVGRLARNDGNKEMLVTLGVLPLLLALTTSNMKIEQEESIEALWMLAFNEENQPKMVAEPNLIETIDKLQRTTEGNVKKTCNGILWTLRNVLKANDKFKHLVKIFEEKLEREKSKLQKNDSSSEDQGHVMISYQWGHQDILKQIRNELQKNKQKVWMDIDNMEGSTLEAMANAIEGAKVVVMCMSQKYKDSPNCRAEAGYAFQKRRPIIPLIMDRDYVPDGWLGIILRDNIYYDFSGKESFESVIDRLMKAVKNIYDPKNVAGDSAGQGGKDVIAPPPAMDEVDGPPIQRQRAVKLHSSPQKPTDEDEKIKNWTSQQVGSWLKKHNLNGNPKLSKLTGMEIVFLQNLRDEV